MVDEITANIRAAEYLRRAQNRTSMEPRPAPPEVVPNLTERAYSEAYKRAEEQHGQDR